MTLPEAFEVAVADLVDGNIRDSLGTDEELDQLGDSLLDGQWQPILVVRQGDKWRVVDGHRRKAAATPKGKKALRAVEIPADLTLDQVREVQYQLATLSKGLSDVERVRVALATKGAHPGLTHQELAKKLKTGPPTFTQLVTTGHPDVEAAFFAGLIPLSTRYELTKFDPAEQPAKLALVLGKKGGREILAGERKKARAVSTIRLSAIRIPLNAGLVVSVQGRELGTPELVEALSEALKSARKAMEAGYDVRTFAAMAKDRAKAAG